MKRPISKFPVFGVLNSLFLRLIDETDINKEDLELNIRRNYAYYFIEATYKGNVSTRIYTIEQVIKIIDNPDIYIQELEIMVNYFIRELDMYNEDSN
jgi:hypothetical protein